MVKDGVEQPHSGACYLDTVASTSEVAGGEV